MKKHVMQKWVKALRSGKFKQTKDLLQRQSNSYCCLGVLCKIAPKSINVELDDKGKLEGDSLSDQESVKAWSGLKSVNGKISIHDSCLAELNDCGYSFKKIADVIEKNWKKL